MDALINSLKKELSELADNDYRLHVAELFDLNVDNYLGVRIPVVRKIATSYQKLIRELNEDDFFNLCNQLLEEDIHELKVCAYQWVKQNKRKIRTEHLPMFEVWLETYTIDWADCDDICTNVLGEYFLKFFDQSIVLLEWTNSKNRWKRRAATVALIKPLRRGKGLEFAFAISERLLNDNDDLVQKGYGWILKVASQNWPDEVYKFVTNKADIMPRTAFRYAIEKYPKELRDKALKL